MCFVSSVATPASCQPRLWAVSDRGIVYMVNDLSAHFADKVSSRYSMAVDFDTRGRTWSHVGAIYDHAYQSGAPPLGERLRSYPCWRRDRLAISGSRSNDRRHWLPRRRQVDGPARERQAMSHDIYWWRGEAADIERSRVDSGWYAGTADVCSASTRAILTSLLLRDVLATAIIPNTDIVQEEERRQKVCTVWLSILTLT